MGRFRTEKPLDPGLFGYCFDSGKIRFGQSEKLDEIVVADRASPFQCEGRISVADVSYGGYPFVIHPGILISGRTGPLLGRGFVTHLGNGVGESCEPASPGNPAFQVRKFEVTVGIDHTRNQQPAEKFDPCLGIGIAGRFDSEQGSVTAEREYPSAQQSLRGQDVMG